jgi:hypothetical protein
MTENSVGSYIRLSEAKVQEQWGKINARADQLQLRTSAEGAFPVAAGSALYGDDRRSDPFQVSHAAQLNLVAAVDHLHAICTLVYRAKVLHAASLATLARGSLETSAAAIWMLGPVTRDERIGRALRWQVKNIKDGDLAAMEAGIQVPTTRIDRLNKIKTVVARTNQDPKAIERGYTSTDAVRFADDQSNSSFGVLLPWRICSGFAHGRPWAYLGFSELEKRTGRTPEIVNVQITTDLSRALYLAWSATATLNEAVALFDQRSKNHL